MCSLAKASLQLVTDERAIDTDNFSLCDDFSAIGVDRELNRFFVTYDRVMFRKMPAIIQAILEANGFVFNFENALSCLDHLCFGIRSAHASDRIKNGSPCLVIKFPDKKNIGALLGGFYKEINKYEDIIAGYHANSILNAQKKRQNLENEVKILKEQNTDLKQKIENLTKLLVQLQSAHEHALTSKNSMPADMAFAKTKEIIPKERLLILRSRDKSYRVSLSLLDVIPETGQICLIVFQDNQINKVFLYGKNTHHINKTLGSVLYVRDNKLKLRDDLSRRVYVFRAHNDTESAQLVEAKRGSKVIVHLYKNYIIKLDFLTPKDDTGIFQDLMHEHAIKASIDHEDEGDETWKN